MEEKYDWPAAIQYANNNGRPDLTIPLLEKSGQWSRAAQIGKEIGAPIEQVQENSRKAWVQLLQEGKYEEASTWARIYELTTESEIAGTIQDVLSIGEEDSGLRSLERRIHRKLSE